MLSGLSSSKEAMKSGAFLVAKLRRLKTIEKIDFTIILKKVNELQFD